MCSKESVQVDLCQLLSQTFCCECHVALHSGVLQMLAAVQTSWIRPVTNKDQVNGFDCRNILKVFLKRDLVYGFHGLMEGRNANAVFAESLC